jgi:hypothetical protein
MPIKFLEANMLFSSADKRRFFDRAETLAILRGNQARILGLVGANARLWIQKGMRRATSEKPSKPGTPPKQRMSGDNGLRKITYNLGDDKESVNVKVIHWRNRSYNQPAIHEFGGVAKKESYRLTPKGDTKWMFEPENAAKYIGLQKSIREFTKYSKRAAKRKKWGKENPKTMDDFGLVMEFRRASFPKRSFLKTGATKYARSGHFKRAVAGLLKG